MTMVKVLIVEDEAAIRTMVAMALALEGFETIQAANAKDAHLLIVDKLPTLILLDWMLPDLSGPEFAQQLKRNEQTREIPIIMLTARSDENDKVRGLESGADDYITKPFSPRELVARIKAVLRRTTGTQEKSLDMSGLKLDPETHRVTAHGHSVSMGPTEFRILHFFMTHTERVYSRNQLIDQVWGGNVYIDERTVDVHIRRLRKALEIQGFDQLIQTVRGVGYRFSGKI